MSDTECAICRTVVAPPYWTHGVKGGDGQPGGQTWPLCARCHDLLADKQLDELVNHITLCTILSKPAGADPDLAQATTEARALATVFSTCLDSGALT